MVLLQRNPQKPSPKSKNFDDQNSNFVKKGKVNILEGHEQKKYEKW